MSGKLKGRIPEPLRATVGTDAAPPPKQVPNSRFLVMVHPLKWGVIHGKLLPEIGRLSVEPGVGLVDRHGSYTNAIAHRQKQGWTVLPEDVQGEGTNYLRSYEVPGGTYWCLEWEDVYPGTDRVGTDEDGYCAFLQNLIDTGKVPRCPDYTIDAIEAKLKAQVEQAEARVHQIPELKPQLDRLRADLEVARAERAARNSTVAKAKGKVPAPLQPRGA